MAPTQEFKTELILNAAAYFVHQDPAPVLMMLPTDKLAESFSKDRLEPLIYETPLLEEIAPPRKSRSPDATLLRKAFETGAVIDLVGANSPTDLSSRPKRVVLADEVDKYPASAGKEGDPLLLAEKRQSTFWNRKSIRTCSPTVKGFSRIGREYAESDQRKLFVHCPHCGEGQTLTWDQVHWEKDEDGTHRPETAAVSCKCCGALWSERERRDAVRAVAQARDFGWRQTKPFKCCGEDHRPATWTGDDGWDEEGRVQCPRCGSKPHGVEHAGFNVSKIYSVTQRLDEMVTEFLRAKADPHLLQVWVNTQLAEEWEEGGAPTDDAALMRRREAYARGDLPAGVIVLTAGVDVQDDRLEYEIVGWGAGRESWGVEYGRLYGDPASAELWAGLDRALLSEFRRADGLPLRLASACVDSGGHHAQAVFEFTAERWSRRVYAIKGDGGAGKPVWPRTPSKSKTGYTLFIVGANAATDQVYSYLKVEEPGPGYSHFPADYDEVYFKQLVSERPVTRRANGVERRVYEKPPGVRNEALDCRKYALAALMSLGPVLPAPGAPGASAAPPRAPKPKPSWMKTRRSWL